MKRLFLIINSLHGGGAEHVAQRLSEEWCREFDLTVISLCPFSENDYDFKGRLISIADSYAGLTWYHKVKNAAKRIDDLAQQHSPDVMVSFLQNANLCLMLSKYNAKKIISIRNYLDRQYSGVKLIIWEYLIKKYFRRADYVVSVSELINCEMKKKLQFTSQKCKCIYNPYDVAQLQMLEKEPIELEKQQFFSTHKVLCNMGHLHSQKGQFHLIRILHELRKTNPEFGLVIIGKDKSEYANRLKKMVDEMGLTDHVLFTGITPNPYKYIGKSFLFIFPSLYEGFPNALVEAMACGVPVIAADCKSGPREILQPNENENYGILISDDQTAWLDAKEPLTQSEKECLAYISSLIDDENLYNTYRNRVIVRTNDFSKEKILGEWNTVLDD